MLRSRTSPQRSISKTRQGLAAEKDSALFPLSSMMMNSNERKKLEHPLHHGPMCSLVVAGRVECLKMCLNSFLYLHPFASPEPLLKIVPRQIWRL